jgi:hypothetical protein
VRHLTRRDFLGALGVSVTGAVVGGLSACGGADAPVETEAPARRGRITGVVVNEAGRPRALGSVFLLRPSGEQTGRQVDVLPDGRFTFDDVDEGAWQIRFHAPRVAYVMPDVLHPIRVQVRAGEATTLDIPVDERPLDYEVAEIYIGDGFFQEQPFGRVNAETVVKLGTTVCWYNVGMMVHTATGGPWADSGPLGRTQSFMWVADRTGVFAYRCSAHPAQMLATLRVVE